MVPRPVAGTHDGHQPGVVAGRVPRPRVEGGHGVRRLEHGPDGAFQVQSLVDVVAQLREELAARGEVQVKATPAHIGRVGDLPHRRL